jgi:hypothetical protein
MVLSFYLCPIDRDDAGHGDFVGQAREWTVDRSWSRGLMDATVYAVFNSCKHRTGSRGL